MKICTAKFLFESIHAEDMLIVHMSWDQFLFHQMAELCSQKEP